jgi:hypothetical protein
MHPDDPVDSDAFPVTKSISEQPVWVIDGAARPRTAAAFACVCHTPACPWRYPAA